MHSSSVSTIPQTWFYAVNGQQTGPVSQAEIKILIRSRIVKPETLVWCEGMHEWQEAKLTELAPHFPSQLQSETQHSSQSHHPNYWGGNSSGQGETATVPAELQGEFNWGACILAPFWAASHNLQKWAIWTFIAFLLVGVFYMIPGIFLASKANELAWKNREWESIDQCLKVQRIWKRWAIGFLAVWIIFALILAVITLQADDPFAILK